MEGIAAYEEALSIKPMLPAAHNALGIAYAQLGDRDRAAWHFREAIRQDPGNPGYADNLDVLGR
jgi:Flp pilus assembly protein TadD